MHWNLRHLMAMDEPKDIRFEFQLSFSSKVFLVNILFEEAGGFFETVRTYSKKNDLGPAVFVCPRPFD